MTLADYIVATRLLFYSLPILIQYHRMLQLVLFLLLRDVIFVVVVVVFIFKFNFPLNVFKNRVVKWSICLLLPIFVSHMSFQTCLMHIWATKTAHFSPLCKNSGVQNTLYEVFTQKMDIGGGMLVGGGCRERGNKGEKKMGQL